MRAARFPRTTGRRSSLIRRFGGVTMGKARRKKAARVAARSTRPLPPRPSMVGRTRAFTGGMMPVLAIVLGTRQLLAAAFGIPCGSMGPKLLVGDWLFVNKL